MKWIVAGLAATLLLSAACQAKQPDTVRLLVFGAPEELAAYRALAAAYPTGKVELIEANNRKDLLTRLSTSIAGGSPPDAFLMNYRFYGHFASKNAIEPVDGRLAGSSAIKAGDFYPQVMSAFRWRGRQLCMPQNVSSLVVYYNRDLFRKHEIPEPKPGWNWNDMVATASALTRDANGEQIKGGDPEAGARTPAVHGLGIEPSLIRVAPFVWSNGGALVDDEARPTRLTLDSPPARDALQDFLELGRLGVIPSDVEMESEGDEARFANGRLAMLLSSRRSTTTFRTIKNLDWDVAPLPVHKTQAGVLHTDAYCIPRGAANPDGAWKFIEFALGAKGSAMMAATGRTVPSVIAVAQSPAFLDPTQAPRHAQVFLDAIPYIRATPTISTWPEIEDVTGGILENALYHGDPVDAVIAQLDRQTRPLFARGTGPG